MNIDETLNAVRRYTRTAPVDVIGLAEELGVPIVYEDLGDDVSGVIRQADHAPNGYEIAVNEAHAETRKRFTIAHELGHFIYHRDFLGRGTGDTRAYRAEPGTGFPNPHITPREERQANAFAANLLMPLALIAEFRERGVRSSALLAQIFKVSEEAMRIRLGLPRMATA